MSDSLVVERVRRREKASGQRRCKSHDDIPDKTLSKTENQRLAARGQKKPKKKRGGGGGTRKGREKKKRMRACIFFLRVWPTAEATFR